VKRVTPSMIIHIHVTKLVFSALLYHHVPRGNLSIVQIVIGLFLVKSASITI
jgi:hypothetical protein